MRRRAPAHPRLPHPFLWCRGDVLLLLLRHAAEDAGRIDDWRQPLLPFGWPR